MTTTTMTEPTSEPVTTSGTPAIPPRGLTRRTRLIALLTLCLVTVGLDQWTKWYAVHHWKGAPPQIYLNGIFRIEYAENHGAFLSLLANTPPEVRFWILTVSNGFILLGLAIGLVVPRRVGMSSFLPLALVVAGGIGNLIDRVRFRYVIDFLNLGIGELRTGIFNVADMAITAGFLLILPFLFQSPSSEVPKPDAAPGPEKTA